MMMREFQLKKFRDEFRLKGAPAKEMFDRLMAVEERVIGLVRLFQDMGYLSPEQLKERLFAQPLPGATIEAIAGFLAGYLAAETYESRVDVWLFGPHGSLGEKGQVFHQAFGALVVLMEQLGVTALPERMPLAKLLERYNGPEPRKKKPDAKRKNKK